MIGMQWLCIAIAEYYNNTNRPLLRPQEDPVFLFQRIKEPNQNVKISQFLPSLKVRFSPISNHLYPFLH